MLGREFSRDLIEVHFEEGLYRVTGLITPPKSCRASRSMQYSVVADLDQLHAAGLPGSVTRRAHEVLRTLEASAPKNKVEQMDFDALQEYNSPAVPSEMMEKLEAVDVETLTPIEALNFLYELKKTLKGSLNG